MQHKVFYLGSYDTSDSKYKRRYAISAVNKMNYIISALNQAGYNVEIISPSYIINDKFTFDKGCKKKINENTVLNLSPTFTSKLTTIKYLGIAFTLFCVFLKLLIIKREQTLIVYHGIWYSKPVIWAKKIKGFELIVEVEEIYFYAFNRDIKVLKEEINFIKSADKHILVNDLICENLDLNKDKCVICYGSYEYQTKGEPVKFDDDKKHVVYAGSFSRHKGGVYNAIESALYLPNDFVLHILGFGNNDEIENVKSRIEEVNNIAECKVIYEGLKLGEDYNSFMKGCSIGLNPQVWGDYMLYAFPSKVLSYMCLGLNVVTSPLKSLKVSSINYYLNYFEENSPKSLALTIQSAKIFSNDELCRFINIINEEFVKRLRNLLND